LLIRVLCIITYFNAADSAPPPHGCLAAASVAAAAAFGEPRLLAHHALDFDDVNMFLLL
jgi:hypothetical protein